MLKVCGMNNAENLANLLPLQPDLVGFIFYKKSPRNCVLEAQDIRSISFGETKKVGVFVNAPIDEIELKIRSFELDYVQLHGNESPEFCRQVQILDVKVIKAFSVDPNFNFVRLEDYDHIDYGLFDTKGTAPGGNGFQFDWDILKKYKGKFPFLLSGGIGPDDLPIKPQDIHEKCVGIDLNSRFELSPGIKNINLLRSCIA